MRRALSAAARSHLRSEALVLEGEDVGLFLLAGDRVDIDVALHPAALLCISLRRRDLVRVGGEEHDQGAQAGASEQYSVHGEFSLSCARILTHEKERGSALTSAIAVPLIPARRRPRRRS